MVLGQCESGFLQISGDHQAIRCFGQLDVEILGDDMDVAYDSIQRGPQGRARAPGIAESTNIRRVPVFGHLDAEAGIIEQLNRQTPQFVDVLNSDARIGLLQKRRIDTGLSVQRRRIVAAVFYVFPQHVRSWGKMGELHGYIPLVCMEMYVKRMARVVKYY
jgi:hypothetical protein